MEVFFADDSTQKGAREGMGKVVAVGGVFVHEDSLRPLSHAIDVIASDFGIPKKEELKWSPKRTSWIYQNLHAEARENCYASVLQAAAEHGARAIVICWDTGRTRKSGNAAFKNCLDFLFERMTTHLTKRNAQAMIVADKPGGGKDEEEEFLADFVSRIESGTTYAVPDRILLNVLTTPSHLVRHLQLADLVTGITTAMVCGQCKYAGQVFDFVKPLFIQNAHSSVGGSGLKLFPNELTNLYHWVLKETHFIKVAMNNGFPLPMSRFPYFSDEFKI